MIIYDGESRLQLARERADWLADDMRRSRRLTPDVVGYPAGRSRLTEVLRRGMRLGHAKQAEPTIPAYDA